MTDLPSLIVFGSLNTLSSAEEQQELRHSILQQDHLSHVREAICRLPEVWETLLANDAALDIVQGAAAAEQLATWVFSGEALSRGTTQNNILSLPLTILSHLCEYMTYLQQTGFSHSTILDHVVKAGGVQGFCAGLLSALAVAGSRDEGSVGLHGALSVRLAFAIGAYVDLDSLKNGQTSCLALRWKSPNSLASIQNILEKYNSVRRQNFLVPAQVYGTVFSHWFGMPLPTAYSGCTYSFGAICRSCSWLTIMICCIDNGPRSTGILSAEQAVQPQ